MFMKQDRIFKPIPESKMSPEARIASRTHRHRAAFTQRSSSRGACIRFAQAANPGVGPRQRSVSAL
jgi:hypothetical protein